MRIIRPDVTELAGLFSQSTRDVWICSPWVSRQGVDLVKTALASCDLSRLNKFELWMRLKPEDQEQGLTDFGAVRSLLLMLQEQSPQLQMLLYTSPVLHAKVIWTDHGAMIGSANLTSAGLCTNLELGVRLESTECNPQTGIRDALRPSLRPFDLKELETLSTVPVQPNIAIEFVTKVDPMVVDTAVEPARTSTWDNFVEALLSERPPTGGGLR
jgi:phosphatidylserine/phosphatidylglycerophosphate/cardiolipin synthase-like enzyme